MKKSGAREKELFQAILELKSATECARFFTDLCSPKELTALADRWKVALLIAEGIPYREIYKKTGVSTATVTRVARSLVRGENGYQMLIQRMSSQPKKGSLRKVAQKGA